MYISKILIRYKLLRRRYIYLMLVLLILIASIISLSSHAILSIDYSFRNYIGSNSKNILIVYDNRSSTPFTGAISTSIIDIIKSKYNVGVISPEIIIPAYMNDHLIIVRGVDPHRFKELVKLNVIDGRYLTPDDLSSGIIGFKIARKYGIKVGDTVLIVGLITKVIEFIKIVGIFKSNACYDYELIVTLPIARILRGFDAKHVTIIRFKIITKGFATSNKSSIAVKTISSVKASSKLVSKVPSSISIIKSNEYIIRYLHKYGYDPSTLLIIAILTPLIALYSLRHIVSSFIIEHSDILSILRSYGLTNIEVRVILLLKLMIYIILASIAGFIIGYIVVYVLWDLYNLNYIIHVDPPPPDLRILVVTIAVILILYIVFLFKSRYEEV